MKRVICPDTTVRMRRQRGLTLVELVMAMGVGAIVLAAVTFSLVQLLNMNTRNTNYMTAVRNAQNAGFWISRDVQMAYAGELPRNPGQFGIVVSSNATGFPLTLRWLNADNFSAPPIVTTYTLQGNGTLWRTSGGETVQVAEHIDSGIDSADANRPRTRVSYDAAARKLTFRVATRVTTRGITGAEVRTYEVSPRAGLPLQ